MRLHGRILMMAALSGGLAGALVACNSAPPPPQQTPTPVQGQQVPIPTTAAEVPGPVPGNTMTTAYVQFVGGMAYIWGYPLVNAHNRRAAFAEAPVPNPCPACLAVWCPSRR